MASDPNNLYGMVLVAADLPEEEATVVTMRGLEELSRPFRFDLTLQMRGTEPVRVEELLSRAAALVISTGAEPTRVIQGVISRVEIEPATGGDTAHYHARVRLVPRLALLAKNRNSRIFQDKPVSEILQIVLGESNVAFRFLLSGVYAPRPYCVQYEESDLAFVTRLAAEEGWFYFFTFEEAPSGRETVVFCDDSRLLAPIPGGAALRFHDSGGIVEAEADVQRFDLRRRVRPRSDILRAFDYMRPSLDLSAGVQASASNELGEMDPALAAQQFSPVSTAAITTEPIAGIASAAAAAAPAAGAAIASVLNALPIAADQPFLRQYEHHLRYEGQPLDPGVAGVALEQHRRRAATAEGDSRSRRLLPGHTIDLRSSPVQAQNQSYVLTRVEHAGGRPSGPSPLGGNIGEIYRNRFTCIPVQSRVRPPRPKRRVQQVTETAIVVGPAGQEIHTDSLGRIKVQFHWDRQGRKNEHSSIWIRVMHAWAGASWGFQFLPRIGMEVVVTFLGGDMDRPLILGSVYNSEQPVPFQLPREKTKSGIRTNSTRGGGGHNELSFEDHKGYERVLLRSEKDLDTVAVHNHTARAGANLTEHVAEHRFSIVGANRIDSIGGDFTEAVGGHRRTTTTGNRTTHVEGETSHVARKALRIEAHDEVHTSIGKDHHHRIAGDTSLVAGGDVTLRTGGSLTAVVGTQDAPRSIAVHVEGRADLTASEEINLVAKNAITLQCGDSVLRMTPSGIEVSASSIVLRAGQASTTLADDKVKVRASGLIGLKSDDKVGLFGPGALVVLSADAKIDGGQVKLKSGDSSFSDDEAQEGEVTNIEVVDEDGNPVPNERFRIRLSNGREISGVLDADGKATVRFTGEGKLELPEVGRVESA